MVANELQTIYKVPIYLQQPVDRIILKKLIQNRTESAENLGLHDIFTNFWIVINDYKNSIFFF